MMIATYVENDGTTRWIAMGEWEPEPEILLVLAQVTPGVAHREGKYQAWRGVHFPMEYFSTLPEAIEFMWGDS